MDNRRQPVITRHQYAESGAVLIYVAVIAAALFGVAALAIDAAFLTETQSELQNTVDASALAAASGLIIGQPEGVQRAQVYAQQNKILGQGVDLNTQQVTFGSWDAVAGTFLETASAPNSVRVTAQLTGNTQPASPALFFAPVIGQQNASVAAKATAALGNRQLMVVLDRSGSMNDDNASPEQPLTDTKDAAKRFLDQIHNFPIEGDKVGLVYYNDQATLDHPLTDNFTAVKNAIDVPNALNCTNIAAALCVARRELLTSPERAVKAIVLLTDGRTNTRVNPNTCQQLGASCAFTTVERDNTNPAALDAISQAALIAQDGFVLYTISLGNDTNQAVLRQMAQQTGGEHFHAPTTNDLDSVFDQISERIPLSLVQ